MEFDHGHCTSCVRLGCVSPNGCPVETCSNGCGVAMHSCKVEEHVEHTCPESKVPCLNAIYGCREVLRRGSKLTHLEHCPASTVMCRFSHEREEMEVFDAALGRGNAAGEPLIDEKFLKGDLALLDSKDCVLHPMMVDHPGKYPSQDIAARMGVCVNLGSLFDAANCRQYFRTLPNYLREGERLCIDMGPPVVKRLFWYPKALPASRYRLIYTCNQVVRRDEFATHWKEFHLNIQLSMSEIVERCPLYKHGCMYGNVRLTPNKSTLDYDPQCDCFLVKPSTYVKSSTRDLTGEYAAKIQKQQELALYGCETEESLDVLGQLPVEILMKICGKLDSLSLWSLSQVNHYIRKVCLNMVKKKGVVYSKWKCDKATQTWVLGPKIWTFSKVCPSISHWVYTDAPPIWDHMTSCEHYKASVEQYDPTLLWDVGAEDPLRPIPRDKANYERYRTRGGFHFTVNHETDKYGHKILVIREEKSH